jgi:hypothetical protein
MFGAGSGGLVSRSRRPRSIPDPSFWEFASKWFVDHEAGLAENTVKDYRWQLTDHLLPFVGWVLHLGAPQGAIEIGGFGSGSE